MTPPTPRILHALFPGLAVVLAPMLEAGVDGLITDNPALAWRAIALHPHTRNAAPQ